MATKQSIISFRMDSDLKPVVDQWLNQHPGFNISRFLNLAAREYAMHDHVLKKVETVQVSEKTFKSSLKKMMKKHKKTLDELK